jgi:hypothetical protein
MAKWISLSKYYDWRELRSPSYQMMKIRLGFPPMVHKIFCLYVIGEFFVARKFGVKKHWIANIFQPIKVFFVGRNDQRYLTAI